MSEKPISKHSETDWDRIDQMTDDEIDTSDIPPLTEEFFKRAKVRLPQGVYLDQDVYVWFRQQGGNLSERLVDALRQYMQTQSRAA